MFDPNLITRRTNVATNDSLSSYNNWTAQQHYNAFEFFYHLIEKTKPSRILEIGTALGGLSQFLQFVTQDLFLDCPILSYDVVEQPWYKDISTNNLSIRVHNIFNNDYTIVDKDIIDFIRSDGISLVLCDGGDKVREFNLLSKYLKTNDIIMAHDYAPNVDFFNRYINNIIWNWHEIQDMDIENACRINNLIPFMQDAATGVVWVSRRKE